MNKNIIQPVGFSLRNNVGFVYHFQKYGLDIVKCRGKIWESYSDCVDFIKNQHRFCDKNKITDKNIVQMYVSFENVPLNDFIIVGYTLALYDNSFPIMDDECNDWYNYSSQCPKTFESFDLANEQYLARLKICQQYAETLPFRRVQVLMNKMENE